MKLKQIIGFVLLTLMAGSLSYKLKDALKDVEEPLAMGALIVVLILILIVLVIRVTRE